MSKEIELDVLPETPEDYAYADEQFAGADKWETTKPGDWHADLKQLHAAKRMLCDSVQALRTLLQSLADAGIEVKDGKVVDPWVRVEDGLPRQFQRVLIARTNKSVTDAWYESDNYPECPWRDGYGDGHDRSVTHWRPLPPAPKGEPSAL